MMDKIEITCSLDEELQEAIKAFEDFIKDETLAVKIDFDSSCDGKEEILNGHTAKILLNKVK